MGGRLYELLGVARDASAKEIRAAYRRAAKKAHPDAGGSEAAFELLKFAHDVLLDPERRRRYDETGEAEAVAPDNAMAEVMGLLSQVMEASLQAGSPGIDLVAEARRRLGIYRAEQRQQLAAIEKTRAQWRDAGRRLKRKGDGDNLLARIVEATFARLDEAKRRHERAAETAERALTVLADYECPGVTMPPQWEQYSQPLSMWTGAFR